MIGFIDCLLRRRCRSFDGGRRRNSSRRLAEERRERVRASVDRLPDFLRQVLVLAHQVAQDSAIQAAAEMGIDITGSQGQISRRKALEAARLADAARAGKPVSAQVAAAVSRQDALIIAALDAAQRRGTPPVVPAGNASRREAYTDAELAALVRRNIQEKIG